MCVATSGVSGAPSASISVNTSSLHAAADSSIQLIVAVARVADMMIDVEHRRSVEAGDAGAIERAALHDERGVVRSRSTSRATRIWSTAGKRLQEVRRRRVHDDVGLLAERAQRQRHADGRADGVAVGPLMRGEEEAPAGADVGDEARRARAHSDVSRRAPTVGRLGQGERPQRPSPRGLFLLELLEDLLDAILRGDRLIEDEVHFGRSAQRHPRAQQVPHVRGGARSAFAVFLRSAASPMMVQ